jgi:CHAT domain-containing protein
VRDPFGALPNVPAELSAIVKTSPQSPSGIFPGQIFLNQKFDRNALEDNLRGHKILHIATHGEFNATIPKSSYFLLGNGDHYAIPDIQTIQHLKDIHLVVLSACETAKGGADGQGLEVAGLSSYFIGDESKAKAVLASLWKVADNSTALMMQQFYTHIAQGKTKAQAIQAVQQDFIKGKLNPTDASQVGREANFVPIIQGTRSADTTLPNFTHPYYWAPFILIGNSQ